MAAEMEHYQAVKRYLRPDGTPVWVAERVGHPRRADGRVRYFHSQMLDIGAEREASARAHQRARQQAAVAAVGQAALTGLASTWASKRSDQSVRQHVARPANDWYCSGRDLGCTRMSGPRGKDHIWRGLDDFRRPFSKFITTDLKTARHNAKISALDEAQPT